MSHPIQLNPQMKTDHIQMHSASINNLGRADSSRHMSTLASLGANDAPTDSKKWYSCFTNMFRNVGNFFGSIFRGIKELFSSNKTDELPPKTDLQLLQELSEMLDKSEKEPILAQFSKLSEEKRNEIFYEVYKAKNPGHDVDEKFGENLVNQDPKEQIVKATIQGWIAKQEKIIPYVEFSKLVEDGNVSAEVVVDKFNALPADVRGKNLQEQLAYSIWQAKAENTPEHDSFNCVEFIKKAPHDPAIKKAIADTIARI